MSVIKCCNLLIILGFIVTVADVSFNLVTQSKSQPTFALRIFIIHNIFYVSYNFFLSAEMNMDLNQVQVLA